MLTEVRRKKTETSFKVSEDLYAVDIQPMIKQFCHINHHVESTFALSLLLHVGSYVPPC
jgi:hypothetical protein